MDGFKTAADLLRKPAQPLQEEPAPAPTASKLALECDEAIRIISALETVPWEALIGNARKALANFRSWLHVSGRDEWAEVEELETTLRFCRSWEDVQIAGVIEELQRIRRRL